jgi:hypothetical protein
VTLLVGLVSFAAYESPLIPVHGQSLLFVGISIIFLAYGVSLKSRTCAVLLMLAFLLGLPMKITLYRESGTLMQTAGLALLQSGIILWAFWRGIRGTFKYQQWLQLPRLAQLAQPAPAHPLDAGLQLPESTLATAFMVGPKAASHRLGE